MEIPLEQWPRVSALLEEALALPAADRTAWLRGLGPENAELAPLLGQLIEGAARAEAQDFLHTLPRLSGEFPETEAADEAGGDDAQAGDRVGVYALVRPIGKGGMGTVWLAERADGLMTRTVALKLPHVVGERRALAQRFARERQILGGLAHPNIARLYEAGITPEGQPFLAMEYVEGDTLIAHCDARRLDVRARVALFGQVLDAVGYAHRNLVVHRDLKPSNILVTAEGQVRLLDFGIAKLVDGEGSAQETELTRVGGVALTPQYAAPEQILGQPIGTASDVYALGVVLFELLVGVAPYRIRGSSRLALEEAIVAVDAQRASVLAAAGGEERARERGTGARRLSRQLRGDLDTILAKALKKAPAQRYGTVESLAQDLGRWLRGEAVEARPDAGWYRAGKFLRRNWIPVSAGSAVVVALALGMTVALWQAREASLQARTALAVEQFVEQIFESNSANQADPERARQTTARELLDIGARRIGEGMQDAPRAKHDILATLGRMYDQLGMGDAASKLSGQRAEIAQRQFGEGSPQHVDALIDGGRSLIDSVNPESPEARRLLKQAGVLLDARGDRDSRQRARWFAAMAEVEDDDRVSSEFTRNSIRILRRFPPDREFFQQLVYAATLRSHVDDYRETREYAEEAIALQSRPGASFDASLLPTAYERRGLARQNLGEPGGALDDLKRAWELARQVNGEEHPETAIILTTYAHLLMEGEQPARGLELYGQYAAHVADLVRQGRARDQARYFYQCFGDDLRVYGRLAESGRVLLLAQATVSPGDGGDISVRANQNRQIALLDIDLGRFADANWLLAENARLMSRSGIDAGGFLVQSDTLARLRLLMAQGRYASAREMLDSALPAGAKEHPGAYDVARLLVEAQIAAGLKDPSMSLERALRALSILHDENLQDRAYEMRASRLAGNSLLAKQDAARALPYLERAVQIAEHSRDPERSPELSLALASLGKCRREMGLLADSELLFQRAARIMGANRELSPAFLEELGTLRTSREPQPG